MPNASLQMGKASPTNECTGYGTKQFDDEVPEMLKILGNAEYPFLPSFQGLLFSGMVAPDSVLSWGTKN